MIAAKVAKPLVKLPSPRLQEPFGQRHYPAARSTRGLGCLIAASALFLLIILATIFMPRGGNGAVARNRNEVADLPTNVEYLLFEGISDSDLEELPELADVTYIDFENCPKLRGPGLKHLARVPQLRAVIFGDCPSLEDTAVVALRVVKVLERFEAYGTTKLTDAAIVELSLREDLALVSIGESPSVSLAALKELRRMRSNCRVFGPYGDVSLPNSDAEHARHQKSREK